MRRIPLILAALICGLAVATVLAHPKASSADGTAIFSPSANPMTFDFVAVGATSPTQTTTITNRGTADLKLTQVLLGGRDAKSFRVASDGCTGVTLAPGTTCAVGVSFNPEAAGTLVAWLRFTDNASSSCYDWINIAGSGTDTAAPAQARASACSTDTSTTTVTTTVTTPGSTTTTPGNSVTGSSIVTFPSTCSSRRTVTLRLKAPKGQSFTIVKVLLRGKTIKTLKGKSIKTKIPLAGLPRGRFTVEVRATLSGGGHLVRKHHYVTCVAARS